MALSSLVAGPDIALAQNAAPSAGQLVQRSLAPEVRNTATGVAIPDAPHGSAPSGADRITLQVRDIVVEGGDPELQAETQNAIAAVRGRKQTVATLYAAAGRIEQAYARKGYFLTRVVIPPQTVKTGGTLRFVVIDGYIESIDASALDERVRGRVMAVVGRVTGKRKLKLQELERALLLAGDTPGLELKSNLRSGGANGAVQLALGGRHRIVSGQIGVDNSLSAPLGAWTATASLSVNSPLGFGEQFYGGVTTAPNYALFGSPNPRRLFVTGAIIPLGTDGLNVNLEYAWSKTRPHVDELFALPTQSRYARASIRLNYAVIRTRSETLNARFSLEAVNETNDAPLFAATLYEDRLRVARGSLDWSRLFDNGLSLSMGADVSQGLGGFGARSSADATLTKPISRAGANADFTKIEGRFRLVQSLPAQFSVEVSGRGQYAAKGLLFSSEQFALGGPRELSGNSAASFAGDHGWIVRSELQYNHSFQFNALAGAIQPYVFAGRGRVYVKRPTAVERRMNGADSIGFGARATLAPSESLRQMISSIEFGAELARQLNTVNAAIRPEWRFNAYGLVRF